MKKKDYKPPKWITVFLHWVCPSPDREIILGDLLELYDRKVDKHGKSNANFYLLKSALSLLFYRPRKTHKPAYTRSRIGYHYIKVGLRNLRNQKVYSFINVFGLSTSIALALIILIFIIDEVKYESHHENRDSIYKVLQHWDFGTFQVTDQSTSPALGPDLKARYAEIDQVARVWRWKKPLIAQGNNYFYEDKFAFADPSLFDLFTIDFLYGGPSSKPYTVVLTEKAAKKYFGDVDPLGTTLLFYDNADSKQINNKAFQGNQFELVVTGVMKNPPGNSEINFDFLASYATFGTTYDNERWSGGPNTFLKIPSRLQAANLEQKLPQYIEDHLGSNLKEAGQSSRLMIMPLTQLREYFYGGNLFIGILTALMLVILFLGCINFMNLVTAQAVRRAKEIGVRKVSGAVRSQLILQFLSESIIMAFISLPIAIGLATLVLPTFNQLVGKNLAFNFLENGFLILGTASIVLITGLMAGSYPAFYMSRFKPEHALSGQKLPQRKNGFIKSLIVIQFSISIFLMVSVMVLNQQLNYSSSKDLGFNKEQILILSHWNKESVEKNFQTFKNKVLQDPDVQSVSVTAHFPGYAASNHPVQQEGKEKIYLKSLQGDFDFMKTFGFQLIEGRDFSEDIQSDRTEAVIVNEAALEVMGWNSPKEAINEFITNDKKVIGVVKDFHVFSTREKIAPTIIEFPSEDWNNFFVAIKLSSQSINNTIADIENTWKSFFPEKPMKYMFLDGYFQKHYEFENMARNIFSVVTIITLSLAAMGLFGMSTFAVERRTKEIGIRKVLGSNVSSIVGLISREFLMLIILANIIGLPLAYLAMNEFLKAYAYRIQLEVPVFLVAGTLSLAIAFFSVGIQASRAGRINPVRSLKYE